jgi:hypothetical protein
MAQEQMKDEYTLVEAGEEFEAVVFSVGNIEIFTHAKFGEKPFVNVGVEFGGVQEVLKLFLPKNKLIRPDSTAGKLFKSMKINKLSAMVGKKVKIKANKDGYLRFAVEEKD